MRVAASSRWGELNEYDLHKHPLTFYDTLS